MSKQFVDADTFQGGGKDVTFEFVVMEHLRRITRIASQEWHGGKMIYKAMVFDKYQQQDQQAFYIESNSEAYTHAVECLMDLLLFSADNKLLEFEKQNNKEIDEAKKKLIRFGEKGSFEETDNVVEHSIQVYEDAKEVIYRECAFIRRKLFREIIRFLRRNDFFNSSGQYEEELV